MSPGRITTPPEPDREHDRVVVAHALAFPVGWRRMQHVEVDVAEAQAVACLHGPPLGSDPIGGLSQPPERRVRRHGHAFPDRARAKAPDNASGAADVIGIAVRQHERVERARRRRRAARATHARADVEDGTVGRIRSGAAGSPPASTSNARPSGRTSSVASPCPTSRKTIRSEPRRGSATPSRVAACGADDDQEAEERGHDRGGAGHARRQQRQDERAVVRGQHTPGRRRESRESHGATSTSRAESTRPRAATCTT